MANYYKGYTLSPYTGMVPPFGGGVITNPFDKNITTNSLFDFTTPKQGYSDELIPMPSYAGAFDNPIYAGGRSLLDNIYGMSTDRNFQINTPNVVRMKNANEMGLLRRKNPTSTDTSAFVDPNIFDPYLRNKIPPKPNVGPEYEPYLKWNGKEWIMDYPEELETPNTKVEGVSNQPNIEIANQREGILDKGFSSQGKELANQGLLSAKDTKKETKKEKGLLDSLVDLAQTDFGRDFFMGMDTGYSKEPKSLMQSIQQGYAFAKGNQLERDKLDIERLKANKMGGNQNFAYIVTDPNTGNKYNAFVDSKNGRVLVNVDGEKKAWSPNMFGGEIPAEISTVSNLGKSDLTGNVFIKEKRQLTTYENQLKKLARFMENVDNGPVGMEKLATQWKSYINTILGKNDLTPQELRQKVLEGDFQALIGANRLEVVGGGVMTEQDAIRIITAIGGDPADIETNPEAVITQISKIFGEKYNLYKDALDTYNINVTSGGFGAYPKKEAITFNDNFLSVLSPDTALELDLAQIPNFSKTQLLRLIDLNTDSNGLVIDDAFTDIQKEQIIALAKTFGLELDFDEEIE